MKSLLTHAQSAFQDSPPASSPTSGDWPRPSGKCVCRLAARVVGLVSNRCTRDPSSSNSRSHHFMAGGNFFAPARHEPPLRRRGAPIRHLASTKGSGKLRASSPIELLYTGVSRKRKVGETDTRNLGSECALATSFQLVGRGRPEEVGEGDGRYYEAPGGRHRRRL